MTCNFHITQNTISIEYFVLQLNSYFIGIDLHNRNTKLFNELQHLLDSGKIFYYDGKNFNAQSKFHLSCILYKK